ncbi:hypothetical protein BC939DRAFT_446325 [Gamsiella multidivaricata]|uniref:uncharacterized protein n=1 Tax=Gamsiella multidivaricata TaxID=101098 RepID=UPI00221F6D34|nr:uncharacterized protein BC939DRAFT_446325 [Gamsiella multidivaricata]KAG0369491.1 hypothetical protein BGZ54_009778 [Gamsiella multidivaricata]KAI7826953.1 hypothetical protein BC939DRAFT_446325 [Gamsiella multidivaricata]
MKFIALAALLISAVAVTSAALPVEPKNSFALAQEDHNQNQNVVESKSTLPSGIKAYIVVFKQSAAAQVIEKAERDILDLGGKIGHRYSTVMKGFSAWIPTPVVKALATNPFIEYIEEDGEVFAFH